MHAQTFHRQRLPVTSCIGAIQVHEFLAPSLASRPWRRLCTSIGPASATDAPVPALTRGNKVLSPKHREFLDRAVGPEFPIGY